MKKTLLVLLSLTVLSAVSYGGWEHLDSTRGTYWTDGATAATCWIRNNTTHEIMPAIAPSVYYNTIRIEANATIGEPASFGLWGVNASGDYYPLADVGVADYTNRKHPGWRVDVEWEVNSSGDLVLKD